ncbi:hypothetical protein PUR59_08720 [Streptomyces sp. SP18ES09]|uniref:hypothetical protein n=1 Tax=Streptomyces sp. SP18ES09 TaxID=3002532 RepID=UPI002E765A92|nr:hypothetical protein [Streptomyces sp. SP18ES09]MEE1815096.1 hypothetical protein [Streptomyces sp. SP18ES09]
MRLHRALPIVAVIPALLLASACSGESTESGDKKPKATAGSADDKNSAEAKRLGALDGEQLEKAALTGKTAGFDAKKITKAEVEAGRDMKADTRACQPLASLIGGFTHLPAVATAHRSLQPTDAKNATVGSMWLASHSEPDATRVMTELRAAVTACPKGFKTLGLTYGRVEGLPAPKLGAGADDTVAYRITGDIGKQKVPMTYTVVRSGGVVAAFYGVNMLDPNHAAIPGPVVEAQLEKIADVRS